MKDIKIIASAFSVPDQVITNDDLSKIMDTSDEWIKTRTGIERRHVSNQQNTSDLAYDVAQKLIDQSNITKDEIDLIIVATMSPDSMTPATAAIVQGKLGAKNAIAFDISAACSGFSYGLAMARSFMIANNLKHAIVIGAEVLSKLLDWSDRSTAVLFGDGAGGVLLSLTDEKHYLSQDLNTFGDKGNKLVAGYLGVNKNYQNNDRQLTAFSMDGRQVYRFATHEVPNSILRAAENADLTLDNIDYFLLHQANERIIAQVAKKIDQPIEKFPINIDEYGNTAAASEAILLAELVKNKTIKKGNIVALSGFGGGLTTATIIFKY